MRVMNVRVSLIILAAAIFMAVWDADQKAMHRDSVALAKARATQQALVGATTAVSGEQASTKPEVPATAIPVVQTATSGTDVAADCIPVPARLAAGTWEVTSESGRQSRITIHTSQFEQSEQNFCIITTEQGHRWCFVRVANLRAADAGTEPTAH
ncbi:MAG: hypothetical protein RLZZ232_3698 [Planctomycetota bacterium]|jgi:hypothetical protein